MEVKQIEAKDTYQIRHSMLRKDMPIETCYFDGDHDDNTFHLGAYKDNQLISVASFFLKNSPHFPEEYQYQLRGMATLESFQGKGSSSALLRTAFPIIKRNHVNLLWCNARVGAVGFYEKVGFELASDIFEIENVGPHYLMKKTIVL